MEFKHGDKIRYIDDCEICSMFGLIIGTIYTFNKYIEGGNDMLHITGVYDTYCSSGFELVKKEQALPVSEFDYYRWLSERE